MFYQNFTNKNKTDTLSVRLGGEKRTEQLGFHLFTDTGTGISNFQHRQDTLELPASIKTVVLNNTTGLFQEGDQVLELTPYQTVVLELVE